MCNFAWEKSDAYRVRAWLASTPEDTSYFRDLAAIISAMLKTGMFIPSAEWVIRSYGCGMNRERAEALRRVSTEMPRLSDEQLRRDVLLVFFEMEHTMQGNVYSGRLFTQEEMPKEQQIRRGDLDTTGLYWVDATGTPEQQNTLSDEGTYIDD